MEPNDRFPRSRRRRKNGRRDHHPRGQHRPCRTVARVLRVQIPLGPGPRRALGPVLARFRPRRFPSTVAQSGAVGCGRRRPRFPGPHGRGRCRRVFRQRPDRAIDPRRELHAAAPVRTVLSLSQPVGPVAGAGLVHRHHVVLEGPKSHPHPVHDASLVGRRRQDHPDRQCLGLRKPRPGPAADR